MKSKKKRILFYIVSVSLLLLLTGYIVWGNVALQTTVYEVVLPKGEESLDGFTIVQISDLHNARFGKDQSRLHQRIREVHPDMIVITGDLVDSERTDIEAAMELIECALETAPVYYVTGNHEAWLEGEYNELEMRLEEAGVYVMNNTMYSGQYYGFALNIAGVRDPDMPGNNVVLTKQNIKALMADTIGYTILLSHRPELFDTYVESGADLVLTGHAHGGQVRIPFIGGVVAPDQGFFPAYTEGAFTKENTTMIVSRGLGNSVIPIRINNRPEIVVVKLQAVVE